MMQLQLIPTRAKARVRLGAALVRHLVDHAEAITGLNPGELYQRDRSRELSWIRFAVMKVAQESGRSTTVIGRTLGLDHTSVIYGCRRAVEIEAQLPEVAELMRLLRREAGQ